MIIFPIMLYRSPGQHKKPSGGTYKYISVDTQESFDEKLAEGWFLSSADAIIAAGDNATPPSKPKPKWMKKPIKKRKPSKPLDWREKTKAVAALPVVIESEPISEDAAPTRAELEAKATELGIRFDGRTKDKKLGQLIQDRLSENTGE